MPDPVFRSNGGFRSVQFPPAPHLALFQTQLHPVGPPSPRLAWSEGPGVDIIDILSLSARGDEPPSRCF